MRAPSPREGGDGSGWERSPVSWVLALAFPALLHEREAVLRERLLVGEHLAPDLRRGRERRKTLAESFDHEQVLVADLLQVLPVRLPVHAALAGRGAVVLGDVDMDHEVLADVERL